MRIAGIWLAVVLVSGCAHTGRVDGLKPGMDRAEVLEQMGYPDEREYIDGMEIFGYGLVDAGYIPQIVGGVLTIGIYPFLAPGTKYYTLIVKDGKLIGWKLDKLRTLERKRRAAQAFAQGLSNSRNAAPNNTTDSRPTRCETHYNSFSNSYETNCQKTGVTIE